MAKATNNTSKPKPTPTELVDTIRECLDELTRRSLSVPEILQELDPYVGQWARSLASNGKTDKFILTELRSAVRRHRTK